MKKTTLIMVIAVITFLAMSVPAAFCEEAYRYVLAEKFVGPDSTSEYYVVMRSPQNQFFPDARWEFAGFLALVPVQTPKIKNLKLKDEFFFEFRVAGVEEAPKKIWVNESEVMFYFSKFFVKFDFINYGKASNAEYVITKNDGGEKRSFLCHVAPISLSRGQRNIFEPLIEIGNLFK